MQVAWLPQLGEREVGKVEIEIPTHAKEGSHRVRVNDPVRAELCWIVYGAPVTKAKEEWEKIPDPTGGSPQLAGSWYSPMPTQAEYGWYSY